MWGVVARIAAAAAVLTLVQHNISQMYKAYYDERMKEEAGPTKMLPKDAHHDDRDGTARGTPRGGRREGGAGGGRSMSTATIASTLGIATGDALASRRAPGGVGGAASGGGDLTMTRDPRCVAAALRACRTLARR